MLDVNAKYETRGGRQVVHIFRQPRNATDKTICAFVLTKSGVDCEWYTEKGRYLYTMETDKDLIKIEKPKFKLGGKYEFSNDANFRNYVKSNLVSLVSIGNHATDYYIDEEGDPFTYARVLQK